MNVDRNLHREYKVEGMTCAACVRAVEKVAEKINGIKDPNVNLTIEKLSFEIKNEINEEKLFLEIKKAGYALKRIDKSRNINLKITGMSCAACVKAVEKSINSLNGIESVYVNLSTETANVNYNEELTNISSIKNAIKKVGYGAELKENIKKEDGINNPTVRKYFNRFIFSSIFALPLLIISMGPMLGLRLPDFISPENSPLNFALLQLFLTLPIVFQGKDFYLKGIPKLFRGSPNMDTLVGLGTSAAFIYSVYSTIQIFNGNLHFVHHLYFESVGVIIALVSLGKYFENLSKGKTSDAIKKLMKLKPDTALIKRGKDFVNLPVEEIEVGDVILVKPGTSIPVDGIVIKGSSSVDQSMITGESIPVDMNIDSKVIGGTINFSGAIEMKATRVGSETALSRIIKLVEDAQSTKAPIARLADIISGYFVTIVLIISVITLISWILLGYDFEFSLTMSIAVLVIACPCALGLATPTAIMVGSGRAANNGILFKSSESLEQTHRINAVIFDKTGTLTEGKPKLTDVISLSDFSEDEISKLSASMAKLSSHPLDRAITNGYSGDLYNVESFNAFCLERE